MKIKLMPMRRVAKPVVMLCGLALGMCAPAAMAQRGVEIGSTGASQGADKPGSGDKPGAGLAIRFDDASSEQEVKYWRTERGRLTAERDFNRIRVEFFQTIKKELRQAGITRLKQTDDAMLFPLMWKVFAGEGLDVRRALLEHFAAQASDEGDALLAHLVLTERNVELVAEAQQLLLARAKAWSLLPAAVRSVLFNGLGNREYAMVRAAGALSRELKAYSIIPALIAAQVGEVGSMARATPPAASMTTPVTNSGKGPVSGSGPVGQAGGTGGGAGGGGGIGGGQPGTGWGSGMVVDDGSAMAWILTGRQVAYVADLTPVIAEGAVAFDPQVGVLIEGTVLRVIDAVVVAYRVEIHNQLTEMGAQLTGTKSNDLHMTLGWDQAKWQAWWTSQAKILAEKQGV